jgi:hypothetical protein
VELVDLLLDHLLEVVLGHEGPVGVRGGGDPPGTRIPSLSSRWIISASEAFLPPDDRDVVAVEVRQAADVLGRDRRQDVASWWRCSEGSQCLIPDRAIAAGLLRGETSTVHTHADPERGASPASVVICATAPFDPVRGEGSDGPPGFVRSTSTESA